MMMLILSGMTAGRIFVNSKAFHRRWIEFVEAQLEQRGVHVALERLSLNLSGGVMAREVKLYNDSAREQLLASLDRVKVAFDFGQLLRGVARV